MTKPLRIGLVMQGGRGWIGGVEYVNNLILALARQPEEVKATYELFLIANNATDNEFIHAVTPYLKDVFFIDREHPLTFPTLVKRKLLSLFCKIQDYRFDLFFKKKSFDFVYPFESAGSLLSFKKSAAWIPDFQYKYLPQFFSEEEIKSQDQSNSFVSSRSLIVVLSSKCSEADFRKYYPNARARTEVLSFKTIPPSSWFATNPMDVQKRYSLPDKFFIVSNQFWQHKNHMLIFEALKILKDQSIYPVVVCTGHIYDRRRPDYSDVILQTIHEFGLAHQVLVLGLIPKVDQIQLMRRSVALLQPSLFEGWSTVIENARCLGKPMILSDIPVHLEQNPPDCEYFERDSPDALARVVADWWQRLLPGPDLRQEEVARKNTDREAQLFADRFLEIAGGRS